MTTRITLPLAVKQSIRSLLRGHSVAMLAGLAAGTEVPVNGPEQLIATGQTLLSTPVLTRDYVNAVETYARNLRPNRDPAKEKARKAKYATKGVSYGLLLKGNYAHRNELRCVFGSKEHIDRASSDHSVALFSTPEKATAYGQRDLLCKEEGFKVIRVTDVKDARSFTHVTENGSTKVRQGLALVAA